MATKKSVFLLDIDQTIYQGYSPLDLSQAEVEAGLLTPLQQQSIWGDLTRRRQQTDYEGAAKDFTQRMAAVLAGKKRQLFLDNARFFFRANLDKFSEYLLLLLAEYGESHDFYLVTGGFDYAAQAIAEIFPVTGFVATELVVKNGVFTPQVKRWMVGRNDKYREAQAIMAKYEKNGSVALGDSITDVGLMRVTDWALGVNVSEQLKQVMRTDKKFRVVKPSQVLTTVRQILTNEKK